MLTLAFLLCVPIDHDTPRSRCSLRAVHKNPLFGYEILYKPGTQDSWYMLLNSIIHDSFRALFLNCFLISVQLYMHGKASSVFDALLIAVPEYMRAFLVCLV